MSILSNRSKLVNNFTYKHISKSIQEPKSNIKIQLSSDVIVPSRPIPKFKSNYPIIISSSPNPETHKTTSSLPLMTSPTLRTSSVLRTKGI